MKKILLALAFVAAISSCTDNKHYVVKGTISETDMTKGSVIVMTDMITKAQDTAQIVEGKFTFKGPADKTTIKRIDLVTKDLMRNRNYCIIIPEGGKINVNLDSTNVVSGTPVNDSLVKFYSQESDLMNKFNAKYAELARTFKGDSLQAAWEEQSKLLRDQIYSFFDNAYKNNKDNAIALLAIQNRLYDFTTAEEIDSYLSDAPDFVKNYEPVVTLKKALLAAAATKEGAAFADFKGETKDGKEISLSDYVGKGKYVLVDFWASWCSPCKKEIPNIIKVNDKYSKKGLVVLGIPVWDKRESTDKAIEGLGIKYEQIYVGDDKTPTEVYGITGIPQIMLFAPDGTIAKRDLRGDNIEAAIKEALNK